MHYSELFLGGAKKKPGDTHIERAAFLRFAAQKTRLIKYRVHLHRMPYDLIASSADAKDVDNFWAVAAQFYFDGAGLGCGAMKIIGDLRQFYSHPHAK